MKRPSSAHHSMKRHIPGVTQSPRDLSQLFIDSKQKEVKSTQIELEKSRTKFLLHAESKRNETEKELISQKHNETLQGVHESHAQRVRFLAQSHDLSVQTLMSQFSEEVKSLKTAHKHHIDSLLGELNEFKRIKNKELENLKKLHEEKEERHREHTRNLEGEYELIYMQKTEALTRGLQQEKTLFETAKNTETERKLKEIIEKIYEESRLQNREKERKYKQRIAQLENPLACRLATTLESSLGFPSLTTQTVFCAVSSYVQTDDCPLPVFPELPLLHSRLITTLEKKNNSILLLENQLQLSLIRTRALETLIKSLVTG